MNQDPYTNQNQPQGSAGLPPVQPQSSPYGSAASSPNVQPAQPAVNFQTTNPSPQPLGMFPQQPAPTYSHPNDDYNTVDYLNQIAPKEQKTVNRIAVFAMIGAILVSAVLVLVLLANPWAPSANSLIQPLSDRATSLETVVGENEGRLSQTEIAEANTALASTLTTIQTQLNTIIKERKIQKTSTKTEKAYLETLQKKLNDAYQKGTLDRTYTTAMTYELTIFKSQLNKLKRTTVDKSIQSFCNESIKNIDIVLKAYAAFAATKQ